MIIRAFIEHRCFLKNSQILEMKEKDDSNIWYFFHSAVGVLQTLVIALGPGLGI